MLNRCKIIRKRFFCTQIARAVRRRSASPTAIGRISPLDLGRAISLDDDISLAISGGTITLAIAENAEKRHFAVFSLSINTLKCSRRHAEGPTPDPRGDLRTVS